MGTAESIIDHQEIRRWAEQHGGRPSRVKGTNRNPDDPGMLRIDFAEPDEGLEEISWEEWFSVFEDRQLALLRSPDTRFNKLVSR